MNVLVDLLKAAVIVFKNCLSKNFSFDYVKKTDKVTYLNLYKLIQVGITIPISSTNEHSFSSMRQIKN